MRIGIAVVLVLGCGGGGKSSTTTPQVDAPTCSAVADAMVAMMMRGKEKEGIEDTVDGFTTIIRTRCDEDAWTAEARRCLATMKTRADAERCSALLTEEQQANLVRDQKEKFGAPPEEPEPTGAAPPPPGGDGAVPRDAPKTEESKPRPKDKLDTTSPRKRKSTPKPGDPCDGGE